VKGRVHIDGTSGVELASGIHWFLKHFAHCSVSWHATGGPQLNLESLTPAAVASMESKGLVRIERAVPFSFYQNVVTLSYSMAFWDWDR
jgi:alpha-N-acetylglucosaminidase